MGGRLLFVRLARIRSIVERRWRGSHGDFQMLRTINILAMVIVCYLMQTRSRYKDPPAPPPFPFPLAARLRLWRGGSEERGERVRAGWDNQTAEGTDRAGVEGPPSFRAVGFFVRLRPYLLDNVQPKEFRESSRSSASSSSTSSGPGSNTSPETWRGCPSRT